MRFTTFDHVRDHIPKTYEGWSAFIAQFQLRVVADKHGVPLYCPATFFEGCERKMDYVEGVAFGCVDVDSYSEADVERAIETLDELGIGYVLHTTHSHQAGLAEGKYKCRIIIPFDRVAEIDEWPKVWAGMNELVGGIADTACRNANAIYFFPSCPPGGEHVALVEVVPGGPCFVDDLIALAPALAVNHDTIPAPDPEMLARIEQTTRRQLAAACIAKYPPAVQGMHGDSRTFRAAMIGGDYGLTSEEFWPLLQEYNKRCSPPWTDEELAKKLANAIQYRAIPIGWRLFGRDVVDTVTDNDVKDLAKKMAKKQGGAGSKGRLLRTMLDGNPIVGDEAPSVYESIAEVLAENFPNADATQLMMIIEDSINATTHRDVTKEFVTDKIKQGQQRQLALKANQTRDAQQTEVFTMEDAFHSVGLERSTPYTEDEMEVFAREAGLKNPAKLRKRWMIRRGAALYYLVNGQYVGPYKQEEALNAAEMLLSPAGLQLIEWTPTGPKLLSLTRMVSRFGTVASEIITDMTAQKSRYDSKKQHIIEAPCPMLPVPAQHSKIVEQALSLIAGADTLQHAKLLDWLACVPMISEPCAGLYLYGKRGTGKSLIAAGCARLWRTEGLTEIDDITENFNSKLAKCPLVFADERVPKDGRGEPQTDLLRKLVQDRSRSFKRKNLPTAELVGCIRLILAANSPDMLVSSVKHLTNDDIGAIAERFLCIHVRTNHARRYLDSLDLATRRKLPVTFASHVMWLNQNRQVKYGGRFLVEGDQNSEVAKALATMAGYRSEICKWVTGFLMNPTKVTQAVSDHLPQIHVDPTTGLVEILLTAMTVEQRWEAYCDPPKPRIGQIERNLGALSVRRQIGPKKFRNVNLGRIGWWADQNGVLSTEEFNHHLTTLTSRLEDQRIVHMSSHGKDTRTDADVLPLDGDANDEVVD